MVLLLATLYGDIARLRYPTPTVDKEEEGSLDEGAAGGRTQQGIGHILSRSFGKVVEVCKSMNPG